MARKRLMRRPTPRRRPRQPIVDTFQPLPMIPDGGAPLPDFNPAVAPRPNLPWGGGMPDQGVDDSWASQVDVMQPFPPIPWRTSPVPVDLPPFRGSPLPFPFPPFREHPVGLPFNPLAGPTRLTRRPQRNFPTRAFRRY